MGYMEKVLKKAIKRAMTGAQIIDVKHGRHGDIYYYDIDGDDLADYAETYVSGRLVAIADLRKEGRTE